MGDCTIWSVKEKVTYPGHPEISQNTSSFPSLNTSVPYLSRPCIAMHLRQLQLCGGAHPRREGCVANDIPESLPGQVVRLGDIFDEVAQPGAKVTPYWTLLSVV